MCITHHDTEIGHRAGGLTVVVTGAVRPCDLVNIREVRFPAIFTQVKDVENTDSKVLALHIGGWIEIRDIAQRGRSTFLTGVACLLYTSDAADE